MKHVVYVLWFVQESNVAEDAELLIGIYETEAEAKAAIQHLKSNRGFVDFPEGFEIHQHTLGQTGWLDGLIEDKR